MQIRLLCVLNKIPPQILICFILIPQFKRVIYGNSKLNVLALILLKGSSTVMCIPY